MRHAVLQPDRIGFRSAIAGALPCPCPAARPISPLPPPSEPSEADHRLQRAEQPLLDLVRLIARTEARRILRSSRGVTDLRMLVLIALISLTIMIGVIVP